MKQITSLTLYNINICLISIGKEIFIFIYEKQKLTQIIIKIDKVAIIAELWSRLLKFIFLFLDEKQKNKKIIITFNKILKLNFTSGFKVILLISPFIALIFKLSVLPLIDTGTYNSFDLTLLLY